MMTVEPHIIVESTVILAIVGLIYKVVQDCRKNADTIFRRFDEYKASVKNDFVSKDVCNIHVSQMGKDITEIKMDVKELVKAKRNGG